MRPITDEERRSYEMNGYLRLPGVLDPRGCDRLIDEIWKRLPERFDRSRPSTWTGRIQDCCNNLPLYQRKGLIRFKDKYGFRKESVIREIIHDNPSFQSIFTEITGRRCNQVWVRGLHPNLPIPRYVSVNEAIGNRITAQIAKRTFDLLKIPAPPQVPIFGHLDAHPIELGTMLYLNDVSATGGGLAVWPGSHRIFQHAFESCYDFLPTGFYRRCVNLLQRYKPTMLSGGKGDVIVVHNRLMHSNSFNRSSHIRYGVLIDLSSSDWRERDQTWRQIEPGRSIRKRLAATKKIDEDELVRVVVSEYATDPVRGFWMDHPKLRNLAQLISQDPLGASRRAISGKIRARADGDLWVVVSQDSEHRQSFKLDAYGSHDGGKYRAYMNGASIGKSDCGVLVERLSPASGSNVLRLAGRFTVDHYVRIVATRNPISTSPILLSAHVRAGAREFVGKFSTEQKG